MGTPNNTSPSQSKARNEEKTREALRLWVQRNRNFCEIFLDAFCIVDVTNRVVDFNTAFMDLCGESFRKVMKIGDFCELVKTEACPGECPARQILREGKSLRLDELRGSTKAYASLQMIVGGIPIQDDSGTTIGALLTIRNVSAESELQKKYDERKKESIIDGLTRVYNKVYSESMLLRTLKSSMREPIGFSVIMCDIDHFKKVNDTYGHQAGDHVLSMVAQMIKGETRDTDIVGRFGGEEFIIILANCDQKGAAIFAERFRKRVETAEIHFDTKRIPVTVSLGSSSYNKKNWSPGLNAEGEVKELVSRADTALYFAKANGRNQVCHFENLPKPKTGTGG